VPPAADARAEEPALRSAVTAALGEPVRALEDVHREHLEYDAFLAHRSVARLVGTAIVESGRREWRLIEKVTEGPATASPYLLENGRREFAAYASGLLDDLAPQVGAPRAFGSFVGPDGRITLLLEEIHDEGSRPLGAEELLAGARDLGFLAGRWVGRVPDEPWLFSGWITRHSQPEAVQEGLEVLARASAQPAVAAVLRGRIPAAERLVRAQGRLRQILESLPETLCHHDAVGANVMRADGRTVLIDWESVGPGPVGADLASLLFSSARRGDCSGTLIATILEDAVRAYQSGLDAAGSGVDADTARRGFDAAVGLRWKLVRDVADAVARGTAPRRGSAPDETPEAALAELSAPIDVLLASAERVLG
jgi:hypothetical protein